MVSNTDSLKPLLSLLQTTTGVSELEATTVAYWAISTYGLPKLNKFPMLVLYGPAGTGKTTLLSILRVICYKPSDKLILGRSTTPVLRELLQPDTTALIDEADSIKDETLMIDRFDRQSSEQTVNLPGKGGRWKNKDFDLFGATAMHRRLPFKDAAVQSRAIQISKKEADVEPQHPSVFEPYASVLKEIASRVEWTDSGRDRIADTWAPLLAVDKLFDSDWLPYAEEEMARGRAGLTDGHGEEPQQAVWSKLLAECLDDDFDQVDLSAVTKRLLPELDLGSRRVGFIIREFGIEIKKIGGESCVLPGGEDNMDKVGRKLKAKDEWLDERRT